MRKNKINPGFSYAMAILVVGLIVLILIPEWQFEKEKTSENRIETGNMVEASMMEFLSDRSLRFIANHGQAGSNARFHVQGAGHTVLFEEDKIILRRVKSTSAINEIVLQFDGSNQSPAIKGIGKLPGVAHFYRSSDPDQWQTNVPTFRSVLYKELYPGIDMAYIGEDGILESEFYLLPGIDHHQIKMNYRGIKSKRIREDGALVLETNLGELVEKAPIAYQDINGSREDVEVSYELLADGSIGFSLDNYRKELPLIIDPELIFLRSISTAGSGAQANGVVIDDNGDLILAGDADRFFEVTDSIDGSNHSGGSSDDCLLLKLDGNTGEVIYSALLGGAESDFFNDVAIDSSGNLHLTGQSSSSDFPVLNANQETLAGVNDAFYVVLDTTGQITYSTFLGGSGGDWGSKIVIDGMGNTYIAGGTRSTDFPIVEAYQQQNNGGATQGSDNFIAKFNAAGGVIYATYLGGSGDEFVKGLAVNAAGEATIAGYTKSTDYPTANAYQATYAGGTFDMIYSRLNSDGDGLIFSSYFGGSGSDISADLKQGRQGDVFISGRSTSTDFPVIGGSSSPEEGTWDGVVYRIDSTGIPVYSVRSNVSGFDSFTALAVDDSNTAYPVGTWGNTLWVYQKPENDSLSIFYDTLASGHNVSDVSLVKGYLAFAGTYWGAKKSVSASDGSKITAGFLKMIREFAVHNIDSVLSIGFLKANKDGLKVDVDEEGFVTINGIPTFIKAGDVKNVIVDGSDEDDKIDLRQVTKEKFPNLTQRWRTGDDDEIIFYPPVLVNAGDGDDEIIGSEQFYNIILGQDGNDYIVGGDAGNTLAGGNGKDQMYGGNSEDFIVGGKENDILVGRGGNDELQGMEGDDELVGEDGDDKILGGDGNDICEGGDGDDTIESGDGDDICNGGKGNDKIDGEGGNDKLRGNSVDQPGEKDRIEGKSGDDEIISGLKALGIITGDGNDKVKIISEKNENPEKSITAALDTIIIQDTGGQDTLDFSSYGAAIAIDLAATEVPQVIDTSGAQIMLIGNFEVLLGTEFNDSISVSPLADTALFIDGGAGTDVLNYKTENSEFTDNGSSITTTGFAEVGYVNIETVNLPFQEPTAVDYIYTEPESFSLGKNYPNPFSSSTTIIYKLNETSNVKIGIYNTSGQLVTTLVNTRKPAGEHSVLWNGLNDNGQQLNAGVYIYEMVADGNVYREKMLLQK